MNPDDELIEAAIAVAREEGLDIAEILEELPRDAPTVTTAAREAELLALVAEMRLPTLAPDADIVPMTMLSGERGVVPFVHPWDDNVEKQAIMEGAMPQVAAAVGLRAFGQLNMAWALPYDAEIQDPREEGYLYPSEHPRRREIVVITACDGVTVQSRQRDVTRREGLPPEWTHTAWSVDVYEPGDIGGTMVESLMVALFLHRVARAAHLILWNRPPEWWTPERQAAMKRVGHTIMEGGGRGPRGREEMLAIKGDSDLDDQVTLGTLVHTAEGRTTLAPEVGELARSADLWDLDVPDDDEAEGRIPGGIPW